MISYEKLVKVLPSAFALNYCRAKSMFVLNLSSDERKEICKSLDIDVKYLTILEDQISETSYNHQIDFYKGKATYQEADSFTNSPVFLKNSDQMIKTNNGMNILSKQYFYLGDNRPYSTDSRSFGSIPESMIKGKVLFLLFRNRNGRMEMFKSLR